MNLANLEVKEKKSNKNLILKYDLYVEPFLVIFIISEPPSKYHKSTIKH